VPGPSGRGGAELRDGCRGRCSAKRRQATRCQRKRHSARQCEVVRSALPLAWKIAAQHGIDIAQIRTSSGRVEKANVLAYAESRRASGGGNGARLVAASPKARRLAAERDIDVTALDGSGPGGAMTSWKDGSIVQHTNVHIGIAVALDDGLVVPVIHRGAKLIERYGPPACDRIFFCAEQKIRRAVPQCPDKDPLVLVCQSGFADGTYNAEIHKCRVPEVSGNSNVVWLNVAMRETEFFQEARGSGDLGNDRDDAAARNVAQDASETWCINKCHCYEPVSSRCAIAPIKISTRLGCFFPRSLNSRSIRFA